MMSRLFPPGGSRAVRAVPASPRGFTVVELMVALAMGLFLIAGMAGIVMSMKRSFTTEDQLTKLQENQRFVLTVFNNTVRLAGYFLDPVNNLRADAFPASIANPDGTTFAINQAISGTSGAGAASDTLNVRFQSAPGDGLTNCAGEVNSTGANIMWMNSFRVNGNQLTCRVSKDGGSFGNEVVLADNVWSLKVRYGMDTDTDGSVDTYVQASGVTTWNTVGSVRLEVTFIDPINSTATVIKPMPDPILYTINLMNKL